MLVSPDHPRRLGRLCCQRTRSSSFFDTNLGRQWEGFWSHRWRSAKRALESSARIVVCGYGMYPIDRRGRNLLLKGTLAGDVEVCCGGESARIVQELRDHGRRARQGDQIYFEEWVSAQSFKCRARQKMVGWYDRCRINPKKRPVFRNSERAMKPGGPISAAFLVTYRQPSG